MAHLNTMLACVAHDFGRGIESHRLRIQQRCGKRRRMKLLDPGRDVNEERKTRGMAFGKAVRSKTLDLFETALRIVAAVTARHHAADHLLLKRIDRPEIAECRHRTAQ